MPNNDILDDLLARSDKTTRKAEGVVESTRHNPGDESGYDLTNPNLHHGAEDKYAPTPQVGIKSGSMAASAEEAFHEGRTTGESSRHAIGDHAPAASSFADQSGIEGHSSSLNVSRQFKTSAAGEDPAATKHPVGLGLDTHTDTAIDSGFGNTSITAAASDAQGQAISESFNLVVTDSGPTATAIADQSAYEGRSFALN